MPRDRSLRNCSFVMAMICTVTVVILVIPRAGRAAELTPEEFESISTLMADQYGRIGSLFVRYDRHDTVEGKLTHSKAEWAFSGEKRYRKRHWPSVDGEAESKRWGIAVWDGRLLKAYDSELDNGSVRAEHDNRNPRLPSTYTDYTQLLGSLAKGSLAEMLRKDGPGRWSGEWAVQGNTANIIRKSAATTKIWTVDLDRGGLIIEYHVNVRRPGEDERPFVHIEVTDAREVEPGLWLPTRAEWKLWDRRPGKPETLHAKQLVVTELSVNDPAIEEKFTFRFPDGAMYYDFITESSMVAGVSKRALDASVEEAATDFLEKVREGQIATGRDRAISDGRPAPDDIEVLDEATGSRELVPGDDIPWGLSPWHLAGYVGLGVSVILGVLGMVRMLRGRRGTSHGGPPK